MTATSYPSRIEFLLNERPVIAEGLPPQTTLLDFLRGQGLTAAKEGCAEGECGACAVLLVKQHGSGSAYRAVNSCLVWLPMMAGQEVYTVEALARGGKLSEAQEALAGNGGSQCGYCTPGFVASLFAEQYRPDRTGPCDPHALSGNLCRCTGYRPIRDAACSLGPAPAGPFLDRLQHGAPVLESVSYENREGAFLRPASLPQALNILAESPHARLVAGATDLGVESNLRGRRYPLMVSTEALPELRRFKETSEAVEIGAGLTLQEIGEWWRDAPPVVREWLPQFASPLIRNRATLGGNLATASPIGDAAPLLLALDAEVNIAGPQGGRRVPLTSFFHGYRQTDLKPGELLVSIHVPVPFPSLARFYKVAKRRIDDISTVAACFALDLDGAGRIMRARIAYGGVAATPVRLYAAEGVLAGEPWNESSLRQAMAAIGRSIQPISDHRGSAAYRAAVAQSLLEKFWYEHRRRAA